MTVQQQRNELIEQIENNHHFNERIIVLEDQLRQVLPEEMWFTLSQLLDLTTEELSTAVDLALTPTWIR